MADRVLFVGWGRPIPGAEARAIESFGETNGLFERMRQQGKIEGFELVTLEPNSLIGGFALLRGSAEQINAVRADEEFTRLTIKGQLNVDGMCHIYGYIGEESRRLMGMFHEAVANLA